MKRLDKDRTLYSVKADRWDHRMASQVHDQNQDYASNAKLLQRTVETGGELFFDAFWSFYKAEPRLNEEDDIQETHRLDRTVMEQMQEVPAYEDLRDFSMGDPFASADACVSVRETLEAIWDKLKMARETQKRLQEMYEEMAAEMAARGAGGDGEDDEDGEGGGQGNMTDEELEALRQAIADAEQQMQDEVDEQKPGMRHALSQSLQDAADEASTVSAMNSMLWGTGDGTPQMMSYEQRKAVAKLVNNHATKRAFDLVGPMIQHANAFKREAPCAGVEEIVDIEMDSDLSRVALSEFVQLKHPLARLRFMKDYYGDNLQSYEMLGKETAAKGDVIVCVDASGSMSGEPDVWAKAVALTLLHLAKTQRRGFRGILFSNGTREFDFTSPALFTPDRVGQFICEHTGGGTNFVNPLNLARQRIEEATTEEDANIADIIMITDDQCSVPGDWLAEFKADQERLGFLTWGITIGNGWGGARDSTLKNICDGRVMSVETMTANEGLDNLWKGMSE